MSLTLYQIAPSPNSIKPRAALNYKKLPYKLVNVNPQDRETVLAISGQSLTPVLVHELDSGHKVVIFDSQAILRYLDGNFPNSPKLFPAAREAHQATERWEMWTKSEFMKGFGIVISQCFSGKHDAAELEVARGLIQASAKKIEEALADGRGYLGGEAPLAGDFTAGTFFHYFFLASAKHPIEEFFKANCQLNSADFPKTAAWTARVMAFDGPSVG